MSYMEIKNLYCNRDIFLFKQCYSMEKIHGSSSHITWKENKISFFPGGCDYPGFVKLFNKEKLENLFVEQFGEKNAVIYGEVYGGRMQGMSDTYGKDLKFIVFEVKVGEYSWLNVPSAEKVALSLGLEFVSYELINTDLEVLDAERDKLSVQAVRNGMGTDKQREGIVLRPLIEVRKNNGERIIAKHKAENFRETKTPRKLDSERLEILSKAEEISDEWCTEMRLTHVLDQFPNPTIEQTGDVIRAMIADIEKEAGGEVENFKEAKKAIGKKTAEMFKSRIKHEVIREFTKVSTESANKIIEEPN